MTMCLLVSKISTLLLPFPHFNNFYVMLCPQQLNPIYTNIMGYKFNLNYSFLTNSKIPKGLLKLRGRMEHRINKIMRKVNKFVGFERNSSRQRLRDCPKDKMSSLDNLVYYLFLLCSV